MFKNLIILFFLIFIINVESIFAQVIEQDSLALVELYDSTDGDSWTNNTNWKSESAVSTWYGVTVTGNRVTELDLHNNNLAGTIPSSIEDLDSLTQLHLNSNQLAGLIPAEIWGLTNLENLNLHSNQLAGSIPPEIGDLTSLTQLVLSYNQLSGSIPPEIGDLVNLISLGLNSNQLTGSIPPEIGYITNLWYLYLYDNQLTGSIPPEIGDITSLGHLYLNRNQLTDSIPPDICSLTNLQRLFLQDNDLVHLPSLSALSSLEYLRIQDNKFTFEDIEPNIVVPSDEFIYSPQDSIGNTQDTTVNQDSSLTISVSVGGDNNQYQWKKDEIIILSATDTFYTISNATISDAGSYICEITNTVAMDLTLYSRPINVTVIDTTPPQIVSVNPVQNALNISKNTNISVTFDKEINASTINDSTFIVHCLRTGLSSGTYSYDTETNTATFNPDSNFHVGEIASAILTTAIENSFGIPLSNPYEWSFTTEVDGGNGEFAEKVNYGAGAGIYSLCSSDLDSDGDIDLILANGWTDSVSVLLNNGDGTFAPKADYSTGEYPRSVFSSDLDSDGDMDLALANGASNSVSVLLNNGDGTFAPKVDYSTGEYPRSVFSSDLDSDGNMDLAVANGGSDSNSDSVSVLLNNGDGTFAPKVDYGTGDGPYSVFSSDLDSDGDMDLALANGGTNDVSVLLNNGDGTFAVNVDYGVGNAPRSVFSSDLDSDGDMDLAVANGESDNISILLNEGDGTFAPKVDYDAVDGTISVFSSDLDSDDDMDLAAANANSSNVSVFLNNGDGTFAPKVDYDLENGAWSVFSSDLDSDGDMDLAVAKVSSDSVSILLNKGSLLTVTSPNGGENWKIDSTYNITWISSGTSGAVNIEYSTDNGSTWIEISASTENEGSFPWTIPDNQSDSCLVRISDEDGKPSDTSDALFTISPVSGITTPELPKFYSFGVKGISIGKNIDIKYALPEKADVSVTMYDITGKIVKEFSDEKKPGFYSMKIDMNGKPAGVYFIKIKANEEKFTQTDKALLIK